MSEPTARDELVALLGEHSTTLDVTADPGTAAYSQLRVVICRTCGRVGQGHLADVLLAAGWTKGDA